VCRLGGYDSNEMYSLKRERLKQEANAKLLILCTGGATDHELMREEVGHVVCWLLLSNGNGAMVSTDWCPLCVGLAGRNLWS